MTIASIIKDNNTTGNILIMDDSEAQIIVTAMAEYSANHKRKKKAKKLSQLLTKDMECW